MISHELPQAAFARNRAQLGSTYAFQPSPAMGRYLRVVPVAGFAKYPVTVELINPKGRRGGNQITFYGPRFQLAECEGARVVPQAFADVFGVGAQAKGGTDVGGAGGASVDSDTTANGSMVFSNKGGFNRLLNGFYAFQWTDDEIEACGAGESISRRGMVPVFEAALGADATASQVVNMQNFDPAWNLGGTDPFYAALGCGYSAIRHIFKGAGVADGVVIQKWFADPWAYVAGAPPTPIKAGQLVLKAAQPMVDELIIMPDRPGWLYLTTAAANITWTMEVS